LDNSEFFNNDSSIELPAFLSENVVNVLVEKFNIKPIGNADEDLAEMLS